MAQSTPQPIPMRSCHPDHANRRRAGRAGSPSYTPATNTDEEPGTGSSSSGDNGDSLENRIARNLHMGADGRANSGAGDKVRSNNLDQAGWDCFQYPSDQGPAGSLQSSPPREYSRSNGATDGAVAEGGKDGSEALHAASVSQSSFGNLDVPQTESGSSDADGSCARRDAHAHALGHGHRRPKVSIDTSPASLQRRYSPAPPIRDRAAPLTAQPRQPESYIQQADTGFRPAFARTWTPASAHSASFQPNTESQLSLGLSKGEQGHPWDEGALPTDSAKARAPILSPPLAQPSSAGDFTDQTPPSSSSMVGRSSLTWALPPLPEARPFGLSKVPPKSQSFIPTKASPSDTTPLASSIDDFNSSCPMARAYRSKSVSSWPPSGTARSCSSSYSSNQSPSSAMVTSSSYSSLPYSPAVAFLSNFVDSTLPVMPLDEEGFVVGNYIMGKVIGHGGFSIVREAFSVDVDNEGKEREHVAVKIVKTQTGATDNDRVQKMLNKEINIWSQVSHPNILPFIAVQKLATDTFIFCEICMGGHLLHYLTRGGGEAATASSPATPNSSRPGRPLDEEQARVIFNQVAEAVRYLHEEKHIMHRDIKLENILLHESGIWKLCDFGLAEYQDEEAAVCFGDSLAPSTSSSGSSGSSITKLDYGDIGGNAVTSLSSMVEEEEEEDGDGIVGGSLAYCSPEQLRSNKPLRCPLSDIWSLGVVLYALLTGRLPFQDEYEPRLQLQILNGRYEEPMECSAEARDLIRNMFRSKLTDRWNISQVKDSPWCMGTTGIDLGNSSDHSDISSNIFSSFKSTL